MIPKIQKVILSCGEASGRFAVSARKEAGSNIVVGVGNVKMVFVNPRRFCRGLKENVRADSGRFPRLHIQQLVANHRAFPQVQIKICLGAKESCPDWACGRENRIYISPPHARDDWDKSKRARSGRAVRKTSKPSTPSIAENPLR